MKIWITGADGFVGKVLQNHCKKQNIPFAATGRSVDISSLAQIKIFFNSHPDITHIINCAAYTNVDAAEKEPEEAFKSNTLGPENLGKLARLQGLKLVHLSTDYVFDSKDTALLKENDTCAPANIYAKTKYEGELRLLEQFPHACIVRSSWIFGGEGKNFISSLWDKLHKEEKLTVVEDQTNRLTYVDDLVEVLLSLLCHEGVYHFANHGVVSRFAVANQMKEELTKKGHPLACKEILPTKASSFLTSATRPSFSALDTQKIERIIGRAPRSWQSALKEYIDAKI